MLKHFSSDRRNFLQGCAATTVATLVGGDALAAGMANIGTMQAADFTVSLAPRPQMLPLEWGPIADAFHHYVMDPSHAVRFTREDGSPYFVSALEATDDGGMTTLAPILVGKALRGEDVRSFLPALGKYYSKDAGIFIDGYKGTRCEYWYLMNINAMAGGLLRLQEPQDPVLLKQVRSSADRLVTLAHDVHYDFNQQGFNFRQHAPFTNEDRYRQPDTVGGYGYLMLMAHELFGDAVYLQEAKIGLQRYLSFAKNPWYEIPSAALACMAAARLSTQDSRIDAHKAVKWLLDAKDGGMQAGTWGGREVNGLMQGFHSEPQGQAYSMESMMVLPYLLPVVRYCPELASVVGQYALNVAANLRWFYPEYLPADLQSRPELAPSVPYERLDREHDGKSPYAAGDYKSHRSVYGGAYSMWWAALVAPTEDTFISQLHASKSDFLAGPKYPTYLYYNPWEHERTVSLQLDPGEFDIYDLTQHHVIQRRVEGKQHITVSSGGSRVLIVIPAGNKYKTEGNLLSVNGVPVDYKA
jgi:hypothetical protein